MPKKNSAEYKLRKQKRIKNLNNEIEYMQKEIVKYALYCFMGIMIVLYGILHFNVYFSSIVSVIASILFSYRVYKNWTSDCEEELDRLFEDEDLYFGCDAFYNDSGDDNGNWI